MSLAALRNLKHAHDNAISLALASILICLSAIVALICLPIIRVYTHISKLSTGVYGIGCKLNAIVIRLATYRSCPRSFHLKLAVFYVHRAQHKWAKPSSWGAHRRRRRQLLCSLDGCNRYGTFAVRQ